MKTKRTQNTQGIECKFMQNGYYIKVTQLHNMETFKLYLKEYDVLDTVEHFLNSIDEIKEFSLVMNNTSRIKGYLFSVNVKGNEFLNLKDFL